MNQFLELLQQFYKQANYKSIAEFTRAVQKDVSISQSYMKQILAGRRGPPSQPILEGMARALGLSHEATNQLLQAANYKPRPPLKLDDVSPQIGRVVEALVQLEQLPQVTETAFDQVSLGLERMIEGMYLGFGGQLAIGAEGQPVRPSLRPLPPVAPTPLETTVDDLLADLVAEDETLSRENLFPILREVARADKWEQKRRITEALPQLVTLNADESLALADILRSDYHPDYRADIRRRVVEAVPALYGYRPEAALKLLQMRERDEVYTVMAIIEALHDLEVADQIQEPQGQQISQTLNLDDRLHSEVIAYLTYLLEQVRKAPRKALESVSARRSDPERLVKIVIQRITPRLLAGYPREILDLMIYFLRRNEDGTPAEHQNIRRPVSRALPQIFALLDDQPELAHEPASKILQALAGDPDIHVRRALADVLDQLAAIDADLVTRMLDMLAPDPDAFVRKRTWRALLRLAELYPERAQDYYMKLLTVNE